MLSGVMGNLTTLRGLIDSLAAAQTLNSTSSGSVPPTTLQAAAGRTLSLIDSLLSGAAGNMSGPISSTTLQDAVGNALSLIDSLLTGPAGSVSGPISSTTLQAKLGNVLSRIDGLLSGAMGRVSNTLAGQLSGGVAAPPSVTAAVTGPGVVAVNWQPSPTSGLTGYTVTRSLNGGAFDELARLSPTDQSYTDQFFPATLFSSGTVRAKYGVVAIAPTGFKGTTTGEIVVQPPAPVSTPAVGGGSLAACRLDFQRADNMWAAFGTPTGSLGAESISLASGQNKVFITDWKYEKQRNDGSNYYGSHLRIGTNSTSKTIRLHLRSWTLTGLSVLFRTGNDTFWVRLDPNTTTKFQADLMEVFCES